MELEFDGVDTTALSEGEGPLVVAVGDVCFGDSER